VINAIRTAVRSGETHEIGAEADSLGVRLRSSVEEEALQTFGSIRN